jgi:hypothetical protein
MEVIFHGRSMSLFQASQQSATITCRLAWLLFSSGVAQAEDLPRLLPGGDGAL